MVMFMSRKKSNTNSSEKSDIESQVRVYKVWKEHAEQCKNEEDKLKIVVDSGAPKFINEYINDEFDRELSTLSREEKVDHKKD